MDSEQITLSFTAKFTGSYELIPRRTVEIPSFYDEAILQQESGQPLRQLR